MRILRSQPPTPEQLVVITDVREGAALVRGAAGSGKTMTAILRLKQLNAFWQRRLQDGYVDGPIRILLLTYNRTLRGYVEELARDQVEGVVDFRVSTFARWSLDILPDENLLQQDRQERQLRSLCKGLDLPDPFLLEEVDYVLGRFLPTDLDLYIDARRDGRGTTPRISRPQRQAILDTVVHPYTAWKQEHGVSDWNDLAVKLALEQTTQPYHIAIVDEAQDFSGNQIRAITNHLAEQHSVTYILDATQRIYPRGFSAWREVGVEIGAGMSYRLSSNHRNTREIAALARALVDDIPTSDDGTLPDFSSCERSGPLPRLIEGTFSNQMGYVIPEIEERTRTGDDSIAILHSRGGGWFSTVRSRLQTAGVSYVEITRLSEWPLGEEQVALSTMHSSKGLEFDHVYIVGLNDEVTPIGDEGENDTAEHHYRRLLAMAICRARSTVTITYKATEASRLIEFLDPATYEKVEL